MFCPITADYVGDGRGKNPQADHARGSGCYVRGFFRTLWVTQYSGGIVAPGAGGGATAVRGDETRLGEKQRLLESTPGRHRLGGVLATDGRNRISLAGASLGGCRLGHPFRRSDALPTDSLPSSP